MPYGCIQVPEVGLQYNKNKTNMYTSLHNDQPTMYQRTHFAYNKPVLRIRIRIRIRIHRIHMFLDLLDLDPDPFIFKQK
jgi:hypothetical protein